MRNAWVRDNFRRFAMAFALTSAIAIGFAAASRSAEAQPAQAQAPTSPQDRVRFNEHVRPILSAHCFACHGFDAKKRKADLRLDLAEGAYAAHDGVQAVKPGNLEESELWQRIASDDPESMMPPPSTKKPLSGEQKAILKRWIEQGGEYQKHWAFEPPAKTAEPSPKAASWVRNPIDKFILERLEREGLSPQAEADRAVLIRRVSFLLTGLPPTVAEAERFLADDSPQAYERMVDRYLASSRYGEEQARLWLDLARYADTHGMHLDNEREMWLYRDWVVKAFNDNLPFDQFTQWQVAGDLLPNPTIEQQIATGYNRCNVTTGEGGSIEPEWLYRYAVDRAGNVAQTWLGLTAGCAVCHDHKFDPLSTKEFYSLYAFFYSAADPAMDGNVRDTRPFLKAPSPEQSAALKTLVDREAEAKRRLDDALAKAEYRDPSDVKPPLGRKTETDIWLDDEFPVGAKTSNNSRNAARWALNPEFGVKSGRRALLLANSGEYNLTIQPGVKPIVVGESGRLEFWLRPDSYDPPAAFAIQVEGGKGSPRLVWGDESQISGNRQGAIPTPGEWTRLSVPFEKVGLKPGDRVGKLVFTEKGGRAWLDELRTVGDFEPANDPLASFAAWRGLGPKLDVNGLPGELHASFKAGADKQPDPETLGKLRAFYLAQVQRLADSPTFTVREIWERARAARTGFEETIPGTFVFRELEKPRDAFVMIRGQYDKPGEKVEPGTPAILPALAKADPQARATRLDLAKWLTAPENPLTPRVAVNRVWQQAFGEGLVKTGYDFGSQGDLPSHPELLDWLAVRFRESGWDSKQLLKTIVMSATFRQMSSASGDARNRDPENRLYARGPRFRLDAEQLRDNALYVSGLMNPRMGGRGALIYQPPNIWEPVGYYDSNTRYYLQDHGQDLYRRSVYSFLKRTAPPPFMSNFDGPNREQFCAKRERGNTPLQALQLMNDVQHFEAARALAERTLAEAGASADDRIAFLYRTVLARPPAADEVALMKEALASQKALFEADPAGARKAVHVGESRPRNLAPYSETASWTLIANLVLNLDETVTRN